MNIKLRNFADIAGEWIEVEQERKAEENAAGHRTYSSFSGFLPSAEPGALARELNALKLSYVEAKPAPKAGGVWIIGGHWWLEQAEPKIMELVSASQR